LSLSELQKAQVISHKKFYSTPIMVMDLFQGKWIKLGIAHYARKINRLWQKDNKSFLNVINLLTPTKEALISIDYKKQIILEDEAC
jgi:hypothetical protein